MAPSLKGVGAKLGVILAKHSFTIITIMIFMSLPPSPFGGGAGARNIFNLYS